MTIKEILEEPNNEFPKIKPVKDRYTRYYKINSSL